MLNGCAGADGIPDTADDSIDNSPTSCSHAVDQGAICYAADESLDSVLVPKCGGGGTVSFFWGQASDQQEIGFGCIDYYTTQCTFDATNTAINTGANAGTYLWAMRARPARTKFRVELPPVRLRCLIVVCAPLRLIAGLRPLRRDPAPGWPREGHDGILYSTLL